MKAIPTTIMELLDRYEVILLDAYGVLLDERSLLPGAKKLIETLNHREQSFYIVTNGSARGLEENARAYQARGLAIKAQQIVSSGSVLANYFSQQGLSGKATVVLGTEGSATFAREGGAEVVDLSSVDDFEILVLANQTDFPFLPSIDKAISVIFARTDAGKPTSLILTNPDVIYPKGLGQFGITAGGIAVMIEAALVARYGQNQALRFVRIGKPHAPIFDVIKAKEMKRSMIMIGDQIATDIMGGLTNGIAAALLTTGVTDFANYQWPWPVENGQQEWPPFYVLGSLVMES